MRFVNSIIVCSNQDTFEIDFGRKTEKAKFANIMQRPYSASAIELS